MAQTKISGEKSRPAIGAVKLTTNVAVEKCVALLCDGDITADVTFADGDTVLGVPLQKGYNPIQATKVVFGAGTIVALYN